MAPRRDVRSGFERGDLPLVVVSAVALVSGGPLTILRQAVAAARASTDHTNFLFLVHDAASWEEGPNVRFLSFPQARRSYPRRIVTEYVRFPILSRRWRPEVWLSLHDATPPVAARRQAVYCHNPLPYWRPTLRDLRLHPWEVVRSFLYGFVYRTNARRNDRVIGQLPWFTEFIGRYMRVPRERLVVVPPRSEARLELEEVPSPAGLELECFYASLPRVFKNFEEALELCDQRGVGLTVTLSGEENRYARWVRRRARGDVTFAGAMTHEETLTAMAKADAVLFPSRLETFGLPVREAIDLGRTLVLPVRPWTVAVASGYPRAYFYRSVEEGRRILAALRDGEDPPGVRPRAPESDLPRLAGFEELYRHLLR